MLLESVQDNVIVNFQLVSSNIKKKKLPKALDYV